MRTLGLFLFLVITIGLSSGSITAQDSIAKNALYFKLDNLNFVKNNEYFNNIADGYILIGAQLHPKLAFYPHPKAKLEIGVFGLTYSGLDGYQEAIPTFSFTYTLKNADLILGTLRNEDSHKLIAPLMTSESLLDKRRIENGIQYVFSKNKFEVDTWINWEHFIFKGATQNEEFVMGLSAQYNLLDKQKWQIDLPLQNLFYHRGGQINTDEIDDRNVFTIRHTAVGIQLKHQLRSDQNIEFSSFLMQHQSTSNPEEFIFDSGNGFLSNIDYQYKNWKLGIGYWVGDQFVSPRGDDMFQSVSVKTDIHYENSILQEVYAHHTESKRSLFLGEISYQKELVPNINLRFKFNSYFQNYASNPTPLENANLVVNQFDYSLALSIFYHGYFNLNK